jgi:hypothetical protein
MHAIKLIASTSLVALLAACGGGSTGGGVDSNGIRTAPISGAELEGIFNDVASASGSGGDALLALGGGDFDVDVDDLAARDLTAPGSASYEGAMIIANIDTSSVFDIDDVEAEISDEELDFNPSFAMVGRSVMNVTFGNAPEVSGGANGFVGVNVETLIEQAEDIQISEDPDIAEILNALPTVNVDGSLTYSNAELIDFDPTLDAEDDMGLGFDVDGTLTLTEALTGNSDQTVTVSGEGLAGFTDTFSAAVVDFGTVGGQPLGGIAIGVAGQ